MSDLFYGSICLTDLLDFAKNKKHSAFSRGKNGKVYANIKVWINDRKDEYNNDASIQLSPSKEMKDKDGTPYIGNLKKSDKNSQPLSERAASNIDDDLSGIPERGSAVGAGPADNVTQPIDDLPF